MLHCILGGCGTGKSTQMTSRIVQKLSENEKVLVLVPEQFSFEAEKKLYAALGAVQFNRLHTYSFTTLSRDILSQYGGRSGDYASEHEKLLYIYEAVQRCVKQKELLLLEKRSSSPDFIMSLYDIITKIRKAGIPAETWLETAFAFSDRIREKAMDIGHILLHYDRILKEKERYDNLTDLTEAVLLADMQEYFQCCCVYLDEFDSFTGDQLKMLEVILRQAKEVTAVIRADDPSEHPSGGLSTQTFYRLQNMAKDIGLQIRVTYCAEYLRSPHASLKAAAMLSDAKVSSDDGHLHIVETSDPVMETEFICAEICRLLQENTSLRCSDIAIAVKSPTIYFPLLERALERYALPYDLSTAEPVLHKELILCFLDLIALISDSTWQTESILRYVKSPLSGYDPDSASMLEHFCFTWGIDKNDWNSSFWQEDVPEEEQHTYGFGGRELENLRESLITEISGLRRACHGKNVRKICTVLYEQLCKLQKHIPKENEPQKQNETVVLWNTLVDILDTMVGCFGEQCIPMGILRENLLLLIRNSNFSTPPQTLDSIRIVDAQTARLDSPEIVFVPGVIEGVFPGEVHSSGMFSEQELRELEDQHISISRLLPELHADEMLIVNKTLASSTQQLYLTYPTTDVSHAPAQPANVINRLLRLFPENNSIFLRASDLPLHFYVRTMASGYFHYVRHLREDTSELAALRQLLERDSVYAARLSKLVAAKELPTPSVCPETMELLLGKKTALSPSGIEQFENCAFRYFCQYVLHLYIPEQNALTPRTSGDFTHYCLEHFLSDRDREQFLHMTPEQLREEVTRLSDIFSNRFFSDAVRRDGRFQFNYRKTGQNLVTLLIHLQKAMESGHFMPVGFEVKVSEQPGCQKPLTLRNGQIICHGDIDRVDLCEGDAKFLRVIDYKTGTKMLSPEKLADGLDMQMLIYLFALGQNGAYQGAAPSGVFYMPSGQPKQNVFQERSEKAVGPEEVLAAFYQMKGLVLDSTLPYMEEEIQSSAAPVLLPDNKSGLYTVTADQMTHLRQHVEQTICNMVDALRAGSIAPEPNLRHETSPCSYCTYGDICGRSETAARKCTNEEKQQALLEVFGKERGEDEK